MHTTELRNLIDGQWTEGDGPEFHSVNPARPEHIVASGHAVSAAEVARAVEAATRVAGAWARTPMHARCSILVKAAGIVRRHSEEWGLELAVEEGKTKAEGVGEVVRAAQILEYFGNECDRQAGELYASPRAGERILSTRRPVGVVGVITPFNFPIAIPAWKIAPALAYGNTVVWKPADPVPLLAQRLAHALTLAQLPAGVLNLVMGDGQVGSAIVDHPDVDAITFTGSTDVGRRVASRVVARGAAVQAEMGGKNAAVVLDDADIELAVDQIMLGAFRSTGQKCTATSRLIVTEGVADRLLAALAARADALAVGDPTDDAVQMGPVVGALALASIKHGIATAVEQGAQLIAGSRVPVGADLSDGYFVAPTIVELGHGPCDLWHDELFGPVLAVRRASDVEHAFALANDGAFGLSAAVFTQDVGLVLGAIEELEVGVLHVNSESAGADPHVPFGGVKKSGLGPKEQGAAAREFYSTTQTVYLKSGRRTG